MKLYCVGRSRLLDEIRDIVSGRGTRQTRKKQWNNTLNRKVISDLRPELGGDNLFTMSRRPRRREGWNAPAVCVRPTPGRLFNITADKCGTQTPVCHYEQIFKCSLFNSFNISKYDYSRTTDNFKDRYWSKVGGIRSQWDTP